MMDELRTATQRMKAFRTAMTRVLANTATAEEALRGCELTHHDLDLVIAALDERLDPIPIHRTTEGPIETFQGKMKPTTPASDAD